MCTSCRKRGGNILKKTLKIISIVLIIFILKFTLLSNTVKAVEGEAYTVYATGYLKRVIQKNGIVIKTTHAVYQKDGKEYPVYCLDRDLEGVGEFIATYDVSNQGIISDVELWRVITNGYPYKTMEELGVADEAEAYIATKQSIYCYLYNTNLEEYSAVAESGTRIINAMYKILENARNSTETYENQNIEILQSEKWKIDTNQKQYLSKQYEIKSNKNISKYIINLENQPNGCKITNLENQEKSEFNSNEKFKILIPISSLEKTGEFKIKIQTEMETKPAFFGKSPREDLQDYAITLFSYEDVDTELMQNYEENETQILIEKQDEETAEKLKGAKFEILNENKEVIKVEETNKDGQILLKHLMPGKYYVREVQAPDGYELNSKIVETQIQLNEKQTIKIKNTKIEIPEEPPVEEPTVEEEPPVEEEPEIEEPPIEELPQVEEPTIKEIPVVEVPKLPVTGM